jgi:hypothetical protein
MHSPGTLTSRSHTRGGPSGSSPHMKLAMRPYSSSSGEVSCQQHTVSSSCQSANRQLRNMHAGASTAQLNLKAVSAQARCHREAHPCCDDAPGLPWVHGGVVDTQRHC